MHTHTDSLSLALFLVHQGWGARFCGGTAVTIAMVALDF